MESGIATFTGTLSTPPRPAAAAFLRHSGPIFSQCHNNFRHFFPITTTSSSGAGQNAGCGRSKGSLRVKPLNNSLLSKWEVSNYAAPSWLPRFEELDTTNMLLRQRIIFLGSQIDDTTADFIISQLLLLDSEDQQKDIKLFINSPGGSVTAGMGIYDAMKLCKADVSTICMGLAASMVNIGYYELGEVLNSHGRDFRSTAQLTHSRDNATEMSIRIREMAYHKVKLNKILSRATGKPEQQIELDTDRDNFMNAWEAKEYGLVDAVIDDGKPGLVAPIADASPPPKTRVWDLWKIEGSKKAKNNLPSEEKILHNGYASGQGNDEEQGTTQN
ncbi:UNVERIFIED_CONTAM: ATP-dependent Clp protease proteolytic subunit, chloroplastic [Sesamum calycinum]|uniref:ATP-dependent Clp protease proteolytic subunit n=1 Tax=Sesamum calycinum TaxID=2727403 RepID=A0AAW2SUC1_9LAMI